MPTMNYGGGDIILVLFPNSNLRTTNAVTFIGVAAILTEVAFVPRLKRLNHSGARVRYSGLA